MLSIHYETWFIREMLNTMQKGGSKAISALIGRVLNKALPHFVEVLKAFSDNHKQTVLEVKIGMNITTHMKLLVILLILGPELVASIVFTNMVKFSGHSGGVEDIVLINHVIDNLHTHFKYVVLSPDKIPVSIQHIWEYLSDQMILLTGLEKVELGQALVDMCLNTCDEVFNKQMVMLSAKDRANIITIKNELLAELSELAFNPVRLPMIHKPVQ